MKFKKITFSLVFIMFVSFSCFSQVNELWQKDLKGNLLWQQVTSYGNYIVCTTADLSAIDPITGEELWSNPRFANLLNEQIEELSGSPMIIINENEDVSIIDPYSGDVKFNAKNTGVSNLQTKRVLYNSNGILVAGKSIAEEPIMVMLDMSSGEKRWQIDEPFGKIISINELSEKELLIVSLFYIYKVNSHTGDIIWKNATSAEVEQMSGAGGEFLKNFAEKMTENMDFVIRFYLHPNKETCVIAAEQRRESTTSSGTVMVTFKNSYVAFNMADGSRLWKEPISLDGNIGELAFYEDGIIIFPSNSNGKSKINFFNLKAATPSWGKKEKGIPVKGAIYRYLKTEGGYLFVSGSRDNSFLNFLDPVQGILTFEKPVKVSGELISTVKTEKGILFVTTEEVNILDIKTGELLLGKSIPSTPNLIEQKDRTLYVYDLKSKTIKAILLDEAKVEDITTDKMKFEGKEEPQQLEVRENGVLVSSEQNFCKYGFDGKLIFQKYYEAPREPGLKRALLYAQAVRAAYIGAVSYYASGVMQASAPSISEEDVVAGAMVQGVGMAYQEIGNAATDFAVKSFQQANARFKASAEGRDFVVVLSVKEKDNVLLKVNKDTGKIDGEINLGKEKDPKYAVDDVTGQIFKQTSNTKIASYKL
jgi:outer membrane protein assembly factor BamB